MTRTTGECVELPCLPDPPFPLGQALARALYYVYTIISRALGKRGVEISYDPAKRNKTLIERGLDFEDAPEAFAGFALTAADTRFEFGEDRYVTVGAVRGVVVVLVWTARGAGRRIISMRKASAHERENYFRAMAGCG